MLLDSAMQLAPGALVRELKAKANLRPFYSDLTQQIWENDPRTQQKLSFGSRDGTHRYGKQVRLLLAQAEIERLLIAYLPAVPAMNAVGG